MTKTIRKSGAHNSPFRTTVHSIVRQIPLGQTLTYKQVATLAGNPKASRAVGNILNKNFNPEIPCHRVIHSDGKTGGYNRGSKRKKELLMQERIKATSTTSSNFANPPILQ